MLSVAEALHRVLEQAGTLLPVETALTESQGRVLAEAVASDVDSPPHDKSMVDGYAVCGADLVDGRAQLVVQEEITAGQVPQRAVISGCCTRIMTGAPIPDGADAVVMVERTQFVASTANRDISDNASQSPLGTVHIQEDAFRSGQNIMRRGKSLRCGDVVLHSGVEIGPAEIGLLAGGGRASFLNTSPPRLS